MPHPLLVIASAIKHSRFGKPLMKALRLCYVRTLAVPRRIGWVRRRLRLPTNRIVDPRSAVHSGLKTIIAGRDPSYRRLVPHFAGNDDFARFFYSRTTEAAHDDFVTVLPKGKCWGYRYGAVFTSQDEFMPVFSRDPWGPSLHGVWAKAGLPRTERLRGRALYLVTPEAADNYHHWLIDLLPRCDAVEKSGYALGSFDRVILNFKGHPYQWETLDTIGIPRERIVPADPRTVFEADELIVPSLKASNEQIPAPHLSYLRKTFLPPVLRRGGRRIFLSRKDAAQRRITNEDEVFELFANRGFERITLSRTSVAAQAELFSECEALAGPSGAAFANLVFARPGALVVELASPDWLTPFHWMISSRLGLNHWIVGNKGSVREQPEIGCRSSHQWMDCTRLARDLDRCFADTNLDVVKCVSSAQAEATELAGMGVSPIAADSSDSALLQPRREGAAS